MEHPAAYEKEPDRGPGAKSSRSAAALARIADSVPKQVRGAVLMALAAVIFAAMVGLIRLGTEVLHPFVVAFFRNLFALLLLLPWILSTAGRGLRTARLGLYALRGLFGLVAMLSWFSALAMMPLAEAVSLSFTTPLFATVGAALVLHETVRARRWTATIIGFVGVLIILRPGVEGISWPAMLALLSALAISASVLIIKMLSRTEPSSAIITYMVLFLTPLSLPPALFFWEWPDATTLVVLVGIATFGTLGHLCFTQALKLSDASAVIPLDYLRLPLVAWIGYAFFGETMDMVSWIGAAVIVGATIYIANREATLARRNAAADAAGQPREPGP